MTHTTHIGGSMDTTLLSCGIIRLMIHTTHIGQTMDTIKQMAYCSTKTPSSANWEGNRIRISYGKRVAGMRQKTKRKSSDFKKFTIRLQVATGTFKE